MQLLFTMHMEKLAYHPELYSNWYKILTKETDGGLNLFLKH